MLDASYPKENSVYVKQVQLNLDDVIVNQLDPFEKLAGEHYQLGLGSQIIRTTRNGLRSGIIITTRNEHMLDRLGLGSQNIMTTTNEHLLVKHGVHNTYMNAEDCYSLEPSQALHGQSSLSQPWSQRPQYNESSIGVTFTILIRYLQVISSLSLSL